MIGGGAESQPGPGVRWRMLALAFLAVNLAYGLSMGSFGPTLAAAADASGVSPAFASWGVSFLLLSSGLMSPVVGLVVRAISLRVTMTMGAGLCAAGFVAMAITSNMIVHLASYLLLVGPGIAFLAPVPASLLVSRWFQTNRGRALGVINMPALLSIIAPITALTVARIGVAPTFAAIGGIYCLLALALWTVRESEAHTGDGAEDNSALVSVGDILREPIFWLVTAPAGLLVGAGMMLVAHVVPIALDREFDLLKASFLISAYGLASIPGSFVLGAVADRIGGRRVLLGIVLAQGVIWSLMLWSSPYPVLVLEVAAAGFGVGGVMGPFLLVLGQRFGREMGRALGIAVVVNTVFLFGSPLLASYLRAATGSYFAPICAEIVGFAISAAALTAMGKPKGQSHEAALRTLTRSS